MRSFKKNGRKKLSKKLTQNPQIIINKIPMNIDLETHKTIPTGSQTIAAPTIGIKEANIKSTESNKAPSTLKMSMIIRDANP